MNLPDNNSEKDKYLKKPQWLRKKLPSVNEYSYLKNLLNKNNLHTICESGKCPNIGECWENRTATFMILGDICTRSCSFCAVKTGKPMPPDIEEPSKIAEVIKQMQLKHCVITSVDRDDLDDGGAAIWAQTITLIKKESPNTTIETLIPDFKGNTNNINTVILAKPDIISHNLETVERLTKEVRIQAKYKRSLKVLKFISDSGVTAKSGIMLGLGETEEEIYSTFDDLLSIGCKIITIGQYLQPGKNNLPVKKYILPSDFEKYKQVALSKGFKFVESGPLVRSSYHAEKQIHITTN
ncbi:MAG TPA: lipoyl synthase [Bacteroidales bacterium]|nr:lipoyl synthase [Bacteroidales bacterium]HPS16254.1 lipoyl synthase [Bacteroidales bacterium]